MSKSQIPNPQHDADLPYPHGKTGTVVVVDNLAQSPPVTNGEIEAIAAYLEAAIDELLSPDNRNSSQKE